MLREASLSLIHIWSATIRKGDEDADEAVDRPDNVIELDARLPHRDRMAGLT